ncbi:hypothetical protein EVA_02492 [gut metagenome]|uniref:Uncharacterized protein n=1 Tax=gut metagenome TaxID=749906 RepID=J9D979_9ZZZZ
MFAGSMEGMWGRSWGIVLVVLGADDCRVRIQMTFYAVCHFHGSERRLF